MSDVRVAVSLDAEALLSSFGDHVGLPGLTFGERGFVGLLFDDHALNILYDGVRDAFVLYGPVGSVTPQVGDGFFRRLAREAHFSVLSGEGALTFDDDQQEVVWSDSVPLADLTHEVFIEVLKSAVDRIEFLKQTLLGKLLYGESALPRAEGNLGKSVGFVRI